MIINLKEKTCKSDWHDFYAWHPVITDSGELVWLDKLERRFIEVWGHEDCSDQAQYRLKRLN